MHCALCTAAREDTLLLTPCRCLVKRGEGGEGSRRFNLQLLSIRGRDCLGFSGDESSIIRTRLGLGLDVFYFVGGEGIDIGKYRKERKVWNLTYGLLKLVRYMFIELWSAFFLPSRG